MAVAEWAAVSPILQPNAQLQRLVLRRTKSRMGFAEYENE